MHSHFSFRVFSVFVVLLVSTMCARNPVTGKRMLSFMSTKNEISLGQGYDPQVQATFGVYEDSKLQQFLSEKGMEMAKVSHRPDLPWQFKVVDSPVVNAFAVPGGFVYFTRGILAHFNSEAQMAGVLGHEIGHVTARHGARQQTGQILGQLGLIIGVIAAPELAQFADIANQSMGLLFLKFGRDHETESDELGVNYSTKIGYDARHMATFFGTLRRLGEKSGQDIPTFLSTHPDPGDREKKVDLLARATQQKTPGVAYKENRESYLNLIDGIIYGEDPKQGFVENEVFYHPELKFQFPIPSGWAHQNSPIQFEMASKDGKAMMLLALGKGKTLEEAAQADAQQYSLKVLESRRTVINGNQALVMLSEQVPQQQQQQQQQAGAGQQGANTVRVLTYLIQYNGVIYALHGLTYASLFNQYAPLFDRTAQGFKSLSDPDKLNRQPERVRVKRTTRVSTFADAMIQLGMPATRLDELSILNGMEKNSTVESGMLLKTISK
jgi:predicted Zn-dependent protease